MRYYPHNHMYKVTKEGRIWSVRRYQYLSQFKDRNGYKRVALYKKGVRTQKYVHVMVMETYYCDCPEGMESRHFDGINTNNNLYNLGWCTPSTNRKDTWKHSKSSGIKVGNSKLKAEDIRTIRYLHSQGVPKRKLGNKYNVARCTISKIVNRKTWEWVI